MTGRWDDPAYRLAYDTRVRDAQRRLHRHPGYLLLQEQRTHQRMLLAVFQPNLAALNELLERAATDEELAIELIQNVHRADVRERFHDELSRAMHNHAASTATLIDHTRRVVGMTEKSLREEYERRRDVVASAGEVAFVKGLRNYMLHHSLPFVGHTVSFDNANKPDGSIVSEVQLSSGALLESKQAWTAAAKTFIRACGDRVNLRPTIARQGRLMMDLHLWLTNAIEVTLPIDELNELVTEVNAALMDTDAETARNHPIHEMRRQPLPERPPDVCG